MKLDVVPVEADQPKSRLSAVSNAMRLIKLFSDERYEMGLGELGARLALPKITVQKLTGTLVESGMLIQNAENGKYRLGLAIFELGALMQRKMRGKDEARQVRLSLIGLRDYQ
jgi:IclR family KDG regulon transcriptional repressor